MALGRPGCSSLEVLPRECDAGRWFYQEEAALLSSGHRRGGGSGSSITRELSPPEHGCDESPAALNRFIKLQGSERQYPVVFAALRPG
jgi:hypothetical protein